MGAWIRHLSSQRTALEERRWSHYDFQRRVGHFVLMLLVSFSGFARLSRGANPRAGPFFRHFHEHAELAGLGAFEEGRSQSSSRTRLQRPLPSAEDRTPCGKEAVATRSFCAFSRTRPTQLSRPGHSGGYTGSNFSTSAAFVTAAAVLRLPRREVRRAARHSFTLDRSLCGTAPSSLCGAAAAGSWRGWRSLRGWRGWRGWNG